MPQQELAIHRKKIAVVVDIELDGYFRPDMGEARRAMLLARWCDELQDWPVEAIRAAMAKWCRESPRVRPNYGDILQLLKAAWGERNADKVRQATAEWERKLRANALPNAANVTLTPEEHAARKAEAESKMADLLASLKAKSAQQEADDAARAQEARDSYKRFRPEAAE